MQEYPSYLYRFPFVVPVAGPIVADGAVRTEDGRVTAVGRYADLKGRGAKLEEYDGCVLTPSLINCHAHLELSHLSAIAAEDECAGDGNITDWIRRLLAARNGATESDDAVDAAIFALAKFYGGGCRTVVDIGNQLESRFLGHDFKAEVFFFLELLGLTGETEQAALDTLLQLSDDLSATAHAPYSTSSRLIRALKERAVEKKHLFPIHVGESAEEQEFLHNGTGPFRDFLAERGVDLGSFQAPGLGSAAYLDSLGVLDSQTLCVHGVHVTDAEIDLLARSRASVCLCPGSNRTLGVGTAPVDRYLEKGVPLTLGTDSLASNPMLNLWQEMKLLREDHPQVAPDAVFAMATINGARLLERDSTLGSIRPGATSSLLAIPCAAKTEKDIWEHLTTVGENIELEWIE